MIILMQLFIPERFNRVPRCSPPALPADGKEGNKKGECSGKDKNPPALFSPVSKVLKPFLHEEI